MLWAVMISGFTLGTAGSLHCVGMCGPLSLALPVQGLSKSKKFFSLLLYQLGRIITYSSIGLLSGLAGRSIYLAGYQQAFSITMGAFVLVLACLYFLKGKTLHLKFLNRFYSFVQQEIGSMLRSMKGPSGFLFMGMANGLLPCGMIYVALAATFSFTEISQSVVFMAMFGAGTLPAMMMVAYAGQFMKPRWRHSARKWVPVIISLMGVMLVLRGLDLGIPFVSPALPDVPGHVVQCHP